MKQGFLTSDGEFFADGVEAGKHEREVAIPKRVRKDLVATIIGRFEADWTHQDPLDFRRVVDKAAIDILNQFEVKHIVPPPPPLPK